VDPDKPQKDLEAIRKDKTVGSAVRVIQVKISKQMLRAGS
jgi:hypothetical protein